MEGGRAKGGANFLCLSCEFAALHTHKQAHTYTQRRLAWSRAVSVAFPHPQDTLGKKRVWCESWNEFTACFLHICLSFFFLGFNSFYPAPEPSQYSSGATAPFPPPSPFLHALQRQVFPSCACSKCLPRCLVVQPRECGPKSTSSPSQPSCTNAGRHTASKQVNGSAWNPWMRRGMCVSHFCWRCPD